MLKQAYEAGVATALEKVAVSMDLYKRVLASRSENAMKYYKDPAKVQEHMFNRVFLKDPITLGEAQRHNPASMAKHIEHANMRQTAMQEIDPVRAQQEVSRGRNEKLNQIAGQLGVPSQLTGYK